MYPLSKVCGNEIQIQVTFKVENGFILLTYFLLFFIWKKIKVTLKSILGYLHFHVFDEPLIIGNLND